MRDKRRAALAREPKEGGCIMDEFEEDEDRGSRTAATTTGESLQLGDHSLFIHNRSQDLYIFSAMLYATVNLPDASVTPMPVVVG